MPQTVEYPIAASCLALELGMPIDSYMTGCHDGKGNKLLYLSRNTSEPDLKAFAQLWEERKNARK